MANVNINGKLNIFGVNIFEKIYPVNSIYLSMDSESPASKFGGTWQLLPENYALWTTNGSSTGGQIIDAGLPNIVGRMNNKRSIMGEPGDTETTGAFSHLIASGSLINLSWSGNKRYSELWFDASKSNPIYGKSATVQPPAIKVFAWKRVA